MVMNYITGGFIATASQVNPRGEGGDCCKLDSNEGYNSQIIKKSCGINSSGCGNNTTLTLPPTHSECPLYTSFY
ncbi:hypothetical protein SLEP1_g12019 [Rubroshorea leprosula]|nr:hypothetical protein SLEP1_g12019 [Rubroshorea leprosula]